MDGDGEGTQMTCVCPFCKAEMGHIREFQKTESCFAVRLKGGEIHYEKDDGFDGCADGWGFAECPECGHELPGVFDEKSAIRFLQGKQAKGFLPTAPVCPECGFRQIAYKGSRWRCQVCGRHGDDGQKQPKQEKQEKQEK